MNLLREYIRELLTEAAKGPEDMADDAFVRIRAHGPGYTIEYSNEDGSRYKPLSSIPGHLEAPAGKIQLYSLTGETPIAGGGDGPCGEAWMVAHSVAKSGWGPMLYDVAMEFATLNGGGLVADRHAVSPDARRIWDYYLSNRNDVTAHQLDDLENTLTPEDEDNCEQKVAGFDVQRPTAYSREKIDVDWVKSPLSKRYTAPPVMMNKLRAAGRLIEE
jgi:hypothetical protein